MESTTNSIARRALPAGRQARVLMIAGALAVAALAVVWAVKRVARAPETPTQAPAADGKLRLSAAQLATLTIDPVKTMRFRSEETAEGHIAPDADATTLVFSPYSGRIVKLLAGIGATVKRGEPLFTIEATEFAQGETDLLNAVSQLKLARIVEQRRHAAYDGKGGSLQDWQQSQADLAAAETAVATARDRLSILGGTPRQIADLQSSRAPDPVTTVTAPIAGIVTDRQVGPGEYLQAGASTPAYTIGDQSQVWLIADVREAAIASIAVGQRVEVRVLALPGRIFQAKVTAVGAGVDPVTRRVQVRAALANPDGMLKPQMFATFSIITSGATEAPAVPEGAVVREGDAAHVWVVSDDQALVSRSIRTGRSLEGMLEVLDGLKAGERVVTRGSLFIDRAAQPG